MSEELSGLALLFGKSLYASKDLVEVKFYYARMFPS